MVVESPLDKSGLRAVDNCLSDGDLAQAQQLLASAGASPVDQAATTYLATRLLYLRDRLDPSSAAERLRELLQREPNFPEASQLLRLAEAGIAGSASLSAVRANDGTGAGDPISPPSEPLRRIEVDTRDGSVPPRFSDRPNSAPPPAATRERASKPAGRYAFARDAAESGAPTSDRAQRPPSVEIPRAPALPRAPEEVAATRPNRRSSHPPAQRVSVTPDAGRYALSAPPGNKHEPPERNRSRPPLGRTPEAPLARFVIPRPSKPVPNPSGLDANTSRGTWAETLWPDVEKELALGDHASAALYLENAAADSFLRKGKAPAVVFKEQLQAGDFSELAQQAAEFLTSSYITHHFAPFDRSLSSLARVEWALEATFGFDLKPPPDLDGGALWLLLGAYVGETLCHTHRGEWEPHSLSVGTPNPRSLRVRAGTQGWYPFLIVEQRFGSGGQVPLTACLGPGLARPGSRAWFEHRPCSTPQPQLWPQSPTAERISELGQSVCSSVLSAACFERTGTTLDLSEDSLLALDLLVDSLVDSAVPLSGREAWLQRLALLVGAYTGEILRRHAGGEWELESSALPSDRYILRLPGGFQATPAANIVARAVARKGSQLHGYLRTLLRRIAESSLR